MGAPISTPRTCLCLTFALIVGLLAIFSSEPTKAHGGGLDAYGGHNDNKRGNYHAHQGTCAGRTFASKADAVRSGCRR